MTFIKNLTNYFKKYFYVLGNSKKKLPFIILLFVTNSSLEIIGLSLILPIIYLIIDSTLFDIKFAYLNSLIDLSKYSSNEKISIFTIIIIFIYYFKGFASYFVLRKIVRFTFNQQSILIRKILRYYQSLDYSKIIDTSTENIQNIVTTHIRLYTEQTLMLSLKFCSDFFTISIIICFLAYNNLLAVTFLFTLFMTTSLIYDKFVKHIFIESGKETANATENVLRTVKESAISFKETRILKKENFFLNRVKNSAEKMALFGSRSQALVNAPRYILETLIITFLIILALFFKLTGEDIQNSIGLIGLFSVASVRMLPLFYQCITAISFIRFTKHHLYELYDLIILGNKTLLNNVINSKNSVFENFDYIEFKNVSFSYNNSNKDLKIFENVNLKINSRQIVGISGESGVGKTTFIDIMLGLLKPDNESKVIINNLDLYDHLIDWQKQIAYIPQKISLINDTIKTNITLEDDEKNIDEKMLIDSIQLANLETTIKTFKEGIETIVGDDGIKLSGGQRQRILLARAFYHKRDLIIMDEGTSALDEDNEIRIFNELKKLSNKKTIIFISHNHKILKKCDYILNIKNKNIFKEYDA